MRVLKHEKIMNDLEGRNCHASQCLPLDTGEVFAVWFEGTREGEDDVCIWGALRDADGWHEKRRITEDDGLPHWNPVLDRNEDGSVTLYYKKGKPIAKWYTMKCTSVDHCRSFSMAAELVPGDIGGRGPVRNKVLHLKDGTLLAPASDEGFAWTAFVDISRDGGVSWEKSNILSISQEKRHGIIQPTLWQDENGVHMFLRSTEGNIFRSDSADGFTWTQPRAVSMPNNNSGIDLTRLDDGRIFLVCNPTHRKDKRSPISLFESRDGGEVFNRVLELEADDGQEYSYPCIQNVGNRLYITYTCRRLNISYWEIEV